MTPEFLKQMERLAAMANALDVEPDPEGFEVSGYAPSPMAAENEYYRYRKLNNNSKGNRVRFLNNRSELVDESIAMSWQGR
ncbi:MAG: hypothetical protein SAJ12_07290 [Jaaginema sp. PMC 1079.18]|nr:hypothetical protein [Jaaginema sp. PMC 1080.18]MEC4850801.1 hypothetical protein [Jaaginema sp. PMC 1079.18]MEC4868172.1 hypothetical protein [Jaaginema sp. PMC 1078.18]